MHNILLVDDEHEIRSTLTAALGRRGYRVDSAINIEAARGKNFSSYDLILLDVLLPDGDGIDLLKSIGELEESPPVVMISGHSGIETAVKAMQLGASDFLEKPLSLDRVLITIENVIKASHLRRENRELAQRVYGRLIGQSSEIKRIRKEIEKTAARSSRFFILGENGTGKELIARMIHDRGRYRSGRFVPVNCAALPSELVESELFGHIKGSFTGAVSDRTGRFAEAADGTIFLDEIADMSANAQAKILRILENGELRPIGSGKTYRIDLNVIAATNHDILKLVDDGRFRQDLFYRLNVVTLNIPPLRERKTDIPLLYEHFLKIFSESAGRTPIKIDPEAMQLLIDYQYPGNVRELKNIAERLSIYVDTDCAGGKDILSILPPASPKEIEPLRQALDRFEVEYIKNAVGRCGGNMTEAAHLLGLERSHLYKKLKKLEKE